MKDHATSDVITHMREDGTWQVILEVRFRDHDDWSVRGSGRSSEDAAKDLQAKLKKLRVA